MLTIAEVSRWTGVSVFEIALHLVAIFLTSIALLLKWHTLFGLSFWHVFAPLFTASALNCYFLFIVFVRSVISDKQLKRAFLSNSFNFLRVIMISIFEVLLCHKIEGDVEHGQSHRELSFGTLLASVACQERKIPTNALRANFGNVGGPTSKISVPFVLSHRELTFDNSLASGGGQERQISTNALRAHNFDFRR
ncbi:transmembrane protein [Ditylenchus destructor]|uniref:Transmembrane protein n=1 Tax=Ditylenchus destructor TaxID=166010 RepID=A0AAD4N1T4_9BILA|nr:transmembrane protein [Ditylenchus destructor]